MAFRAERADSSARSTLEFLHELLRDYHPRNFEIELWDGTRWEPEPGQFRRLTWKIARPGALRTALTAPSQLVLAQEFIFGDFDVEGDIEGVFPLADYLLNHEWGTKEKLRLGALLLRLPVDDRRHSSPPGAKLRGRVHSQERDRQAISYHYDVSNDFYGLWLGKGMVYSCAYFAHPGDDLETAQTQKLDYICRKLRLSEGERLLDIGCGWGGLILHAAREYGVQALGITLSRQQFELATRRIRDSGLGERCQVKFLDYREAAGLGVFDKVASIGMVEHVGEINLEQYFRCAYQALRPGGAFLNHGIGVPESRPRPKQPTFVDLYVFPDGDLVPLGTTLRYAERAGFEVRDVENLREHYALTLRHWVRGLEANAGQARRFVDDVTYRIWRLHMAGSAYYFQTGKLDLYQTLLVKNESGRNSLPLTRADWYG